MNDLVVLVADTDMEHAMRALCRRYDDLGTRRFEFELRRYPAVRRYPADRDGGTRKWAHDRLRPESNRFRWALVLFDHHGCGSNDDRQTIQRDGEKLLARNGWREGETLRAKVVVIEPELEAWMWGDLKTLGKCLGWGTDGRHLREWVRSSGLWHEGHPKPSDPKDAMIRATREAQHAVSDGSVRHCTRRLPNRHESTTVGIQHSRNLWRRCGAGFPVGTPRELVVGTGQLAVNDGGGVRVVAQG